DFPPVDFLVVGAHPDDAEIACGGTLARLARDGYRVAIVDLTDGEPTPGSRGPEQRLAEAEAAARVLGVPVRVTLDLPNRRLFDTFEARVALAKVFRMLRPQVVCGFGDKTPMASPDHAQAVQITDAAVFYARLTKWDDIFDGLPVHVVRHQCYFRLLFEGTGPAPGTFTIDISETLKQKLEAIRCYASQFPPEKAYVFDRVRAAAEWAGATAGCRAGEVFQTTRPLVHRDLFHFLARG
ncbi:MAG TPA: LmbE family protein, partial [Bryobacterales bacterium]|nr:LmbE family protein [Bryobacterales bacterium]